MFTSPGIFSMLTFFTEMFLKFEKEFVCPNYTKADRDYALPYLAIKIATRYNNLVSVLGIKFVENVPLTMIADLQISNYIFSRLDEFPKSLLLDLIIMDMIMDGIEMEDRTENHYRKMLSTTITADMIQSLPDEV